MTDIVKTFMSRVKAAVSSKQPEIRLTTQDAAALAAAIGELMATRIDKLETIADMSIEVKMDGGSLNKR